LDQKRRVAQHAIRDPHCRFLRRTRPSRDRVRSELRHEQLRLPLLYDSYAIGPQPGQPVYRGGRYRSEAVILELNNLSSATNHNGGAIHFGPDGKLYIGVGENANGANSQTLSNLLGKMLRIMPTAPFPPTTRSTIPRL